MHMRCWVICLWQPEKLHKNEDMLNEEKEFGKYAKIREDFPEKKVEQTQNIIWYNRTENTCWSVAEYETRKKVEGFPGDAAVTSPPASAGDTGSSPGPGRSHILWSK